MNEQSLFLRALEQPAGDSRRKWLEQECLDAGQRTRIAALLERHEQAGSFLEKPPAELVGQNHAVDSANRKDANGQALGDRNVASSGPSNRGDSQPPEAQKISQPIAKSKFIDRLVRSKLMTAEEVAECNSSLESVKEASDARTYALAMVKAEKLTGFQAKAIYDGRIKGLTFGEYIILDRLGKGGMGIVYRAKHRRMDRIVAIKVLPRSAMATKGLEDRFYREVKTAAKLMHPNIVAALDASEDDGLHYLVMEYVDGQDLGEVLRQSGPLAPDHAVDCIIQAARGLQYAHEQGVIHRDIKPANLLVDSNGTVKVLDMGLARMTGVAGDGSEENAEADSATAGASEEKRASCEVSPSPSWDRDAVLIDDETRLTKAGEVMGTLDYMPPEQFTDTRNVDERGDVYSLGCTFYRLLTGQSPFPADTAGAVFRAHRGAPVPSLRSILPDIPEHLDQVFQKMLAKGPDQRQSSMSQLIQQLEQSLALLRSPQTTSVGELQNASTRQNGADASFPLVPQVTPARSRQLVRSRDQRIRRRSRSRRNWIPIAGLVCSLVLMGLLAFMQGFWPRMNALVSLGTTDVRADDIDVPVGDPMTAGPPPRENTEANLPTIGVGNVDASPIHPPDIGENPPPAIPRDEDSHRGETENGQLTPSERQPSEQQSSDRTATNLMPAGSEKELSEVDTRADRSSHSDVDISDGKPMNWIGGTTWAGGFGFQGGRNFGSAANRQIEFFDHGRRVSISENDKGIIVSVDGKLVEAATPAELKKKSAQAFQLYEKMLGLKGATRMPVNSAIELQRMQLEGLRENHSGNPQMKLLLERMLQDTQE